MLFVEGDRIVLTDKQIRRRFKKGSLTIEPTNENEELQNIQIQPTSLDLRLSSEHKKQLRKPVEWAENNGSNTFVKRDDYEWKEQNDNTIKIRPNKFILGRTKEYIDLPENIVAFIEGRSSIGRKGLFVENAGWIDPGFKGTITLELLNASKETLKIEAGTRICQIVFEELEESPENSYGEKEDSKYQGQVDTTPSKLEKDKER